MRLRLLMVHGGALADGRGDTLAYRSISRKHSTCVLAPFFTPTRVWRTPTVYTHTRFCARKPNAHAET
eukprot:1866362-Lingulodinium_polyedra.AAC.1